MVVKTILTNAASFFVYGSLTYACQMSNTDQEGDSTTRDLADTVISVEKKSKLVV